MQGLDAILASLQHTEAVLRAPATATLAATLESYQGRQKEIELKINDLEATYQKHRAKMKEIDPKDTKHIIKNIKMFVGLRDNTLKKKDGILKELLDMQIELRGDNEPNPRNDKEKILQFLNSTIAKIKKEFTTITTETTKIKNSLVDTTITAVDDALKHFSQVMQASKYAFGNEDSTLEGLRTRLEDIEIESQKTLNARDIMDEVLQLGDITTTQETNIQSVRDQIPIRRQQFEELYSQFQEKIAAMEPKPTEGPDASDTAAARDARVNGANHGLDVIPEVGDAEAGDEHVDAAAAAAEVAAAVKDMIDNVEVEHARNAVADANTDTQNADVADAPGADEELDAEQVRRIQIVREEDIKMQEWLNLFTTYFEQMKEKLDQYIDPDTTEANKTALAQIIKTRRHWMIQYAQKTKDALTKLREATQDLSGNDLVKFNARADQYRETLNANIRRILLETQTGTWKIHTELEDAKALLPKPQPAAHAAAQADDNAEETEPHEISPPPLADPVRDEPKSAATTDADGAPVTNDPENGTATAKKIEEREAAAKCRRHVEYDLRQFKAAIDHLETTCQNYNAEMTSAEKQILTKKISSSFNSVLFCHENIEKSMEKFRNYISDVAHGTLSDEMKKEGQNLVKEWDGYYDHYKLTVQPEASKILTEIETSEQALESEKEAAAAAAAALKASEDAENVAALKASEDTENAEVEKEEEVDEKAVHADEEVIDEVKNEEEAASEAHGKPVVDLKVSPTTYEIYVKDRKEIEEDLAKYVKKYQNQETSINLIFTRVVTNICPEDEVMALRAQLVDLKAQRPYARKELDLVFQKIYAVFTRMKTFHFTGQQDAEKHFREMINDENQRFTQAENRISQSEARLSPTTTATHNAAVRNEKPSPPENEPALEELVRIARDATRHLQNLVREAEERITKWKSTAWKSTATDRLAEIAQMRKDLTRTRNSADNDSKKVYHYLQKYAYPKAESDKATEDILSIDVTYQLENTKYVSIDLSLRASSEQLQKEINSQTKEASAVKPAPAAQTAAQKAAAAPAAQTAAPKAAAAKTPAPLSPDLLYNTRRKAWKEKLQSYGEKHPDYRLNAQEIRARSSELYDEAKRLELQNQLKGIMQYTEAWSEDLRLMVLTLQQELDELDKHPWTGSILAKTEVSRDITEILLIFRTTMDDCSQAFDVLQHPYVPPRQPAPAPAPAPPPAPQAPHKRETPAAQPNTPNVLPTFKRESIVQNDDFGQPVSHARREHRLDDSQYEHHHQQHHATQHTHTNAQETFARAFLAFARALLALALPPAPAPAWPARFSPAQHKNTAPKISPGLRALCARVAHIARVANNPNGAALAAVRCAAELRPPLLAYALAPPPATFTKRDNTSTPHPNAAALRAALAPAALAPLFRLAEAAAQPPPASVPRADASERDEEDETRRSTRDASRVFHETRRSARDVNDVSFSGFDQNAMRPLYRQ